MLNNCAKLKVVYAAHGVQEGNNNFTEYLDAKRWLKTHKMLLHNLGLKLYEAECWLEIYAFNFDTLENDFKEWDNEQK